MQPDFHHGLLAPGTRLGSYEVTALIGQGGMGEVYRARDTKLDRDVALKVLSGSLCQRPCTKVLASLNHPNIAQEPASCDEVLPVAK